MVRVLLYMLAYFSLLLVTAQKDKTKYVAFNANNDVVVVYKSGTVALFSNPDLKLLKEVSPRDKKNVATSCQITSSGQYLVVNDDKADAWFIYDAGSLMELNRVKREWILLPQFVESDMIFLDNKIFTLPDLSVVEDVSKHDTEYDGFAFSPSFQTYINYELSVGEGRFRIYDMATGEILGNSQVDETPNPVDGDYHIVRATRYLDENRIEVVYESAVPYTEPLRKVFPVNMGKNYELKAKAEIYKDQNKFLYDYDIELIAVRDYAIDIEGDLALRSKTVSISKSIDNQFIILGTPKNQLNLYENQLDAERISTAPNFRKSTLLKSRVVPSEK